MYADITTLRAYLRRRIKENERAITEIWQSGHWGETPEAITVMQGENQAYNDTLSYIRKYKTESMPVEEPEVVAGPV